MDTTATIERPADWQFDILRQRRNDRLRAAMGRYLTEIREAEADYDRAEHALAGNTLARADG